MSSKGSPVNESDRKRATEILEKLKAAGRPSKGIKDQVITPEDLQWLLDKASALFLKEPSLLEADPPLIICGDTHGQFTDVLRIFTTFGWPADGQSRYLFLGDYVDRGKQSIEVMCMMFALKIQCPNDVFLLRGNHECLPINRAYGFYSECTKRYGKDEVYAMFNHAFNCMAVCGLIGKRILCMHGGLSPELESLDQIRRIKRPSEAPEKGLIADLLWSDPDTSVKGFQESQRGVAYLFGADAVMETCAKLDIDLVARAHQVVHEGYEFFADQHLVTIFSAPDYCGQFGNAAGFLFVDGEMRCKIKQLKPM